MCDHVAVCIAGPPLWQRLLEHRQETLSVPYFVHRFNRRSRRLSLRIRVLYSKAVLAGLTTPMEDRVPRYQSEYVTEQRNNLYRNNETGAGNGLSKKCPRGPNRAHAHRTKTQPSTRTGPNRAHAHRTRTQPCTRTGPNRAHAHRTRNTTVHTRRTQPSTRT